MIEFTIRDILELDLETNFDRIPYDICKMPLKIEFILKT